MISECEFIIAHFQGNVKNFTRENVRRALFLCIDEGRSRHQSPRAHGGGVAEGEQGIRAVGEIPLPSLGSVGGLGHHGKTIGRVFVRLAPFFEVGASLGIGGQQRGVGGD